MSDLRTPPRRPYESLPAPVRNWMNASLGSPVMSATTQTGGFSAGVAARVCTVDGTRAFVKAVCSEPNPDTPGLFRKEAAALRVLARPALAELTAPLLADYDDGEWVALLLTDVAGHTPTQPFTAGAVEVVSAGLDRLGDALAGVGERVELPQVGANARFWTRWQSLADQRDRLDPWARDHLDELLELSEHARGAMAGPALLHFDIRSDNILLTGPAGCEHAVFVDWAWLRRGARWCDAALFAYELATVESEPGCAGDPESFVAGSSTLREVPARDVTAMVAILAGVMVAGSLKPPPPGLPTMRSWQARMGRGGLSWLRRRLAFGQA